MAAVTAEAGVKSDLGGSSLENGAHVCQSVDPEMRSLLGQYGRADPPTSLAIVIYSLREMASSLPSYPKVPR